MLFCVSFMGLVGIDSTKDYMEINYQVIDDWIDINIFHSIGFSCVILIGTIRKRLRGYVLL